VKLPMSELTQTLYDQRYPKDIADIITQYTLPPIQNHNLMYEFNSICSIIIDWTPSIIEIRPSSLLFMINPRPGTREYRKRQQWLDLH
jgi:hypothetical protein